jgi:hypothetical protein
MIDKIQTKLKVIFTSKFAKFLGHVFLINLTLHFWAEINDPYGHVEEHVKVANTAWIISVCVFYLDKLVMSVYEIKKVKLLCEKSSEIIKVAKWSSDLN